MAFDPPDYSDDQQLNLKVVIALARSLKALHQHAQPLFQAHHLTATQFSVLEFLYHKGDQVIGQINQRVLTTGGNMTVVLDNLEKAGWVERRPAPDDRRALLIHLTETGRQLMATVFPLHLDHLGHFLSKLTVADKQTLVEISKKLGQL